MSEKVGEILEACRWVRPRTRLHLWRYLRYFVGYRVPKIAVTPGHATPLDYLWYAFNVDFLVRKPVKADAIVWASRGGGKTELCGLLTLLECVFKPGVQIRILSGSGIQAGRMYDYFRYFLSLGYAGLVEEITTWPSDKTRFKNGAMVEVLKQSEMSVRGHHVHKLRCDEVELFKPKIWEAAQFTTMSRDGIVGGIDALSTMHKAYGLMKGIVKMGRAAGTPVFMWNVWDVMERCVGRGCAGCKLHDVCEGKGRKSGGYYKVGDVVTAMERSKAGRFNLEMLCGEGGKNKGCGWVGGKRRY